MTNSAYGYDANLAYLTSANYGDGLPNATPSWTYDAAANRSDTVADNLNRPITIGGVSSTSDILGNRLTLGTQSYGWDCLNRMTSYGTANSYVYRADGMRVSKVAGSTSTVYRYDGQMGMEDVDTTGGASTVTDYGLGARGVDYIASTKSGTTTVGFPIYDCHGSMTACLFRSGTTYYSLGNQRHYDAWGIVRNGVATGAPKGRYCASLGHKQDDESGLVYMRARYYEPTSGRFVSQDTQLSGFNWYTYCRSNPLNFVDSDGHEAWSPEARQWFDIWSLAGGTASLAALSVAFFIDLPSPQALALAAGFLGAAACCFAAAFNDGPVGTQDIKESLALGTTLAGIIFVVAGTLWTAKANAIAAVAITLFATEDMVMIGLLADIDNTL